MMRGSRPDSRQATGRSGRTRGDARHGVGHGANMGRGGAAAAADQVEKAALGPLADMLGHLDGIEVVLAKRVGQARVGVGADMGLADARQLLHVLAQLIRPQRAVETERDRFDVAQRVIEGFGGLAGEVRPEASVMVPEIITGRL